MRRDAIPATNHLQHSDWPPPTPPKCDDKCPDSVSLPLWRNELKQNSIQKKMTQTIEFEIAIHHHHQSEPRHYLTPRLPRTRTVNFFLQKLFKSYRHFFFFNRKMIHWSLIRAFHTFTNFFFLKKKDFLVFFFSCVILLMIFRVLSFVVWPSLLLLLLYLPPDPAHLPLRPRPTYELTQVVAIRAAERGKIYIFLKKSLLIISLNKSGI